MNNIERMSGKIERFYKRQMDNIYSHRFFGDLFSGYSYSLAEDKLCRKDFYKISPDDNDIIKLFRNSTHYDFSYEFEKTIDRVLLSLAVYGKAYIFVKPEYIEKTDEEGHVSTELQSIHLIEVKGIQKGKYFYYKNFSEGISVINLCEDKLITFDLKELGYKRKYFIKLIKRIGKYDATAVSIDLINNEPTYDFNKHRNECEKRFLKAVKGIGWTLGSDGLSDSYILYKEIQEKQFKMKMLQYVLGKINQMLTEVYIPNKKFKIEALTEKTNYDEVWIKFQNGEVTVTELSNIVWKRTSG